MAHKTHPYCNVPVSNLRCEAMTKPTSTYQVWRQQPHRCIRTATQLRDGKIVCAIHGRVKHISYWQGEVDPFPMEANQTNL